MDGYEGIPKQLNTPCCRFDLAYVRSTDLGKLQRLSKMFRASKGWKCTMRAFPPFFYFYVAGEDMYMEELSAMRRGEGPTQELWSALNTM